MHCAHGSLAPLAHWRTPRDARSDRSALRAEQCTVLMVRSLRSLTGAPLGMRAVTDRPCGPSNALCSWFARSARSLVLQVAVDELDRHGALADRRRHPLHRVGSDVPRREDTRRAGLEVV